VINNCGQQTTCHYTMSDGSSGCIFPETGAPGCLLTVNPGVSYSMTCVIGDPSCDQSIGCSL
jgi:hypothetical protein